ncbi:PREDICTED: uncharacterized protein LOC106814359 [Priapulus caudatus]|uniref:Uncharacterized protein LOC106814359 n=1 Tax=Priapulus caudatus TaxID=37621 RepID=A0ABM1EPN7_PRICU|nr:PREDICTED: uncharacterized protein LOC106814359 [Priapulus caudatus]
MTGKVQKCIVDIAVHAVTCPGVWLPKAGDVYLHLHLWGDHAQTKFFPAAFPLFFHDKLRFEKVFQTCVDPADLATELEDCLMVIELKQVSEEGDPGEPTVLARYEESARTFLFPPPRLSSPYPDQDREVLLNRTGEFPGISPKLEFTTDTALRQYTWPNQQDKMGGEDEDDLNMAEGTTKARPQSVPLTKLRKNHKDSINSKRRTPERERERHLVRTRSLSDVSSSQYSPASFHGSFTCLNGRPPFVVRHVADHMPSPSPWALNFGRMMTRNSVNRARVNLTSASFPIRRKAAAMGRCGHCNYPQHEQNCNVCRLYRRYFGRHFLGYQIPPSPQQQEQSLRRQQGKGHRRSGVKVKREKSQSTVRSSISASGISDFDDDDGGAEEEEEEEEEEDELDREGKRVEEQEIEEDDAEHMISNKVRHESIRNMPNMGNSRKNLTQESSGLDDEEDEVDSDHASVDTLEDLRVRMSGVMSRKGRAGKKNDKQRLTNSARWQHLSDLASEASSNNSSVGNEVSDAVSDVVRNRLEDTYMYGNYYRRAPRDYH